MDAPTVAVSGVVSLIVAGATAYITSLLRVREENKKWQRDLALRIAEAQAKEPGTAAGLTTQFAAGVLVVERPGADRERFFVQPGGVVTIGRSDQNVIVLNDVAVSRRHARLRLSGDFVEVDDLGAATGVRLRGELVSGSARMSPGDVLEVGDARITFLPLPR